VVMKGQKQILAILLFFVFATVLIAEEYFVSFLDGLVDLKTNRGWQALSIGDSLTAASVVRLESDSMLEISFKQSIITIYDEGIYNLQNLVTSSEEMQAFAFLQIIDSKIDKAVNGSDSERSVAFGVRGPLIEEESTIDFMEEEDDPVEQGMERLNAGNFDEAIEYFKTAMEQGVTLEEEPFVYYLLAYAHAEKQERAQALKYLNKIKISADHLLYTDYVMLKGRLLVESFAYNSALLLFEEYLTYNSTGETVQSVLLLSSFCYKGLGNNYKYKECLKKAKEINPYSELGKEAHRLLIEI